MGEDAFAVEVPIALVILATCPQPTGISLVDVLPKTFSQRLAWTRLIVTSTRAELAYAPGYLRSPTPKSLSTSQAAALDLHRIALHDEPPFRCATESAVSSGAIPFFVWEILGNQQWVGNWLHEKPDKPPDDLEEIRQLPGAVKDLATSIRETPASVARELRLVEHAFKGGCVAGFAVGLIVVVVLYRLRIWLGGSKA